MDLHLLDETYPMEKPKLPFEDFGQGGLTGVEGETCHFWVSIYTPCFLVKLAY
jgi:hypothetical protein